MLALHLALLGVAPDACTRACLARIGTKEHRARSSSTGRAHTHAHSGIHTTESRQHAHEAKRRGRDTDDSTHNGAQGEGTAEDTVARWEPSRKSISRPIDELVKCDVTYPTVNRPPPPTPPLAPTLPHKDPSSPAEADPLSAGGASAVGCGKRVLRAWLRTAASACSPPCLQIASPTFCACMPCMHVSHTPPHTTSHADTRGASARTKRGVRGRVEKIATLRACTAICGWRDWCAYMRARASWGDGCAGKWMWRRARRRARSRAIDAPCFPLTHHPRKSSLVFFCIHITDNSKPAGTEERVTDKRAGGARAGRGVGEGEP